MTRRSPKGALSAGENVPRMEQPLEPEDDWEEGADKAADRYEKDMTRHW